MCWSFFAQNWQLLFPELEDMKTFVFEIVIVFFY